MARRRASDAVGNLVRDILCATRTTLALGGLFRHQAFCRDFLLQHRPEKAVGVRQIREHHQIVSETVSDPVRKVNPLLGQHIRSAKRFELGMAAQKISDNGLVFFFKKLARGVHEAPSCFHKFGGFFEN